MLLEVGVGRCGIVVYTQLQEVRGQVARGLNPQVRYQEVWSRLPTGIASVVSCVVV